MKGKVTKYLMTLVNFSIYDLLRIYIQEYYIFNGIITLKLNITKNIIEQKLQKSVAPASVFQKFSKSLVC